MFCNSQNENSEIKSKRKEGNREGVGSNKKYSSDYLPLSSDDVSLSSDDVSLRFFSPLSVIC